MNIPNTLTAGDSLQWEDQSFTLNGVRYDSVAYALSYELRGLKGLTIGGTTNGSGWSFDIAPDETDSLTAGPYWWSAIVVAPGIRRTVGSGQLQVLRNLSSVTMDGYDGRSEAEKALADAEAALANLTSSGKKVKKYAIGTRNAEFYTAAELIESIRYWRSKVFNEQAAKDMGNGLGNPRNLLVRFQ